MSSVISCVINNIYNDNTSGKGNVYYVPKVYDTVFLRGAEQTAGPMSFIGRDEEWLETLEAMC